MKSELETLRARIKVAETMVERLEQDNVSPIGMTRPQVDGGHGRGGAEGRKGRSDMNIQSTDF